VARQVLTAVLPNQLASAGWAARQMQLVVLEVSSVDSWEVVKG
jgi:hypothetical protein